MNFRLRSVGRGCARKKAQRIRALMLVLVPLLTAAVPAAADLGNAANEPLGSIPNIGSEGLMVSTPLVPLDGQDSVADSGRFQWPPEGEETCTRFSSSALTLEFTSGSVSVLHPWGDRTYNASVTAPVVAEIRGNTPNRFEGLMGSYHDSSDTTATGCIVGQAGTTALTLDTSVGAPVPGIVSFVGLRDSDGESLSCRGGSAQDTYRRGGTGDLGTIEIVLHDVFCGITTPSDPGSLFMADMGIVTLRTHIREVFARSYLCTSPWPVSPNGCDLDWASTDLG